MIERPCRRLLCMVMGLAIAASFGLKPISASAAGFETPEKMVGDLGAQVIEMLKNPSRAEREATFRALLLEGVDVDALSRFVLGRFRNDLTPAQAVEYRKLFEDFIVSTYVSRLGLFEGETFNIKSTQRLNDNEVLVSTLVSSPKGNPIRLDWRIRGRQMDYKIIDVIIEGISMAVTQREEFVAIINSNGGRVEALLTQIRAKIVNSR